MSAAVWNPCGDVGERMLSLPYDSLYERGGGGGGPEGLSLSQVRACEREKGAWRARDLPAGKGKGAEFLTALA